MNERLKFLKTMAPYYAGLGLRVIPLHGVDVGLCTCGKQECKSPGKHPRTINGLKDGTKDKDLVERMWTRWPLASIGICTGTESGVLVLDFDDLTQVPDLLRDWALSAAPPTWRATTGRGGKHVFFRYDSDRGGIRSRTGVWPKVDVRADGGYVVAAPSPHASGNFYSWDEGCAPADVELAPLPEAVEQVLRAGGGLPVDQPAPGNGAVAAAPSGPTQAPPRPGELRLPADEVARIKAALAYIDATERQVWLHVGMALKSTCAGQQAYDLWTEWSQTVPTKFDPQDQLATWNSLKPMLPHAAEIAMGKVFWLAKQAGAPDLSHVAVELEHAPLAAPDAVFEPTPEPEPIENLPGEGAEPVPTDAVEALPDGFWTRLQARSSLLHEIVEWITRTAPKKQRLLAFGNTLAALGALLGRRVRSPGNCRTNLYVFGIAASGRGKEHSRQCISQLFATAGLSHWIGADKWKSDSGIRTELLKAPAHLAQIDEFGKVLAQVASPHAPSHLAGIVQTLLELTGRAGGVDLGPAYADQKVRPREIIMEPCLAIYATAVPNDVFESLSSRSVADGFLNRWICLFGDDRPALEESEDASYQPPKHVIAGLQLLETNWRTQPSPAGPQGNIPSMAPAAHVIPRTPDATARRREIMRAIEAKSLAKQRLGDPLADLWARVPELAERVALIFAATRPVRFERRDGADVAWWDGRPAAPAGKDRDGFPVDAHVPVEMDVADLSLAYDLVSWSFRRFEAEVGVRVSDSEYEAKLKRVLRTLIAAGTKGLAQNEFTRKTQWLSGREREDIARTLADSGQAVVTVTIPDRGGKPVTSYRFAGFCAPETGRQRSSVDRQGTGNDTSHRLAAG